MIQNAIIEYDYDIFISHATEDKESFVRPLVQGLTKLGLAVWYDEFTLDVGDSLRESIDSGLVKSRYGAVILSPHFLQKEWPKYELNGLVSRQNAKGEKVIIPIWHNLSQEEVRDYSPSLLDLVALNSNTDINYICERISRKIKSVSVEKTEDTIDDQELSQFIASENITEELKAKQSVLERLEKFIVEDKFKIKLHQLISSETESLYSHLQTDFEGLTTAEPTADFIKSKMLIYDLKCETLLTLLINGCYWSKGEQYKLWSSSLQRIVNLRPMNSGYSHLIKLQLYPSLFLLYGAGITAIYTKKWNLLKILWMDTIIYEGRNDKAPIISSVYPGGVIDKDVINIALGRNFRTPISDHLYEILRPFFSSLIPQDEEFRESFDMYEYLFGLQFGYMNEGERFGFWAPIGRFHWFYSHGEETHPAKLIHKIIKEQGESWPALKAGLFGGNVQVLEKIQNSYAKILGGISWF